MKTHKQSPSKLPADVLQALLARGIHKECDQGTLIFRPHKAVQSMLFVESGLMRGYRLTDGIEFTHYFFAEQWFATDYQSYLSETPSELYVEAITPCTYFEFSKSLLLSLYDEQIEFAQLGRMIAEQAYLITVQRLLDFQTKDLKARYERLINRNPKLFQQVPQKHIASYLGVTQQSLSRIKSQL